MNETKPENKETDWFPAHVKPVREGVYKTRHVNKHTNGVFEGYSRWRKGAWTYVATKASWAAKAVAKGSVQDKEWKGIVRVRIVTAVYTSGFMLGSHWNTTVHKKAVRVHSDETIMQAIARNQVDPDAVVFLFEGVPDEIETDEAKTVTENAVAHASSNRA